jgi:hypothetical protein
VKFTDAFVTRLPDIKLQLLGIDQDEGKEEAGEASHKE